jgi:5-methylthioribose kinase
MFRPIWAVLWCLLRVIQMKVEKKGKAIPATGQCYNPLEHNINSHSSKGLYTRYSYDSKRILKPSQAISLPNVELCDVSETFCFHQSG